MGLPNNIQNGDVPDAAKLMANFQHCADGKGIRAGTSAELAEYAAAQSAGTFFLAYDTQAQQVLFYCGDGTWKIIG